MADQLAELAARITALEDIEAIRQLKARYLRGCDLKQVDTIRDTLLPVGVRIDYQGFPLLEDREAFLSIYQQMACQGGVFDIHHATNCDITLDGRDAASGRWSLNFRTILLAQRQITRLAVEYEDRYVKQDGRWWIAETKSRITSCLTEEIGNDGSSRYLVWGEPPALP